MSYFYHPPTRQRFRSTYQGGIGIHVCSPPKKKEPTGSKKKMKEHFPVEAQYALLQSLHRQLQQRDYASASALAHTLVDMSQVFEIRPATLRVSRSIASRLDDAGLSMANIDISMYKLTQKKSYDPATSDVEKMTKKWDQTHQDVLKRMGLDSKELEQYKNRFGLEGSQTRTQREKLVADVKWTGNDLETMKQMVKKEWAARKTRLQEFMAGNKHKEAAAEVNLPESVFLKLWNMGIRTVHLVFRADFMRFTTYAMVASHIYILLCIISKVLTPAMWWTIITYMTSFQFLHVIIQRIFLTFWVKELETILPAELAAWVQWGWQIHQMVLFFMGVPELIQTVATGALVSAKGITSWGLGHQTICAEALKYMEDRGNWFALFQSSIHGSCVFVASYFDNRFLNPSSLCKFIVPEHIQKALNVLELDPAKPITKDEVKHTFRKLSVKWHEDKYANASAQDKAAAAAMFLKIQTANEQILNWIGKESQPSD
jgi:hypothetical protein